MKHPSPVWIFSLFSLGVLVLMFVLQLAFADIASAAPGFTPRETLDMSLTRISGSATALKQHLSGTATALAVNIHGTATALKQNISGTATAIKNNISGTVTAAVQTVNAAKTNVNGTVTALAATATAIRGDFGGTATAYVGTLQALGTKYSVTKVPTEQAKIALASYASSTLGISATFISAAGYDATVNAGTGTTIPLPGQLSRAQLSAVNLAVQVYLGKTATNSEAWVAYGTGTVTGNTVVDVQNASLGTFAQTVTGTAADANAALTLAKSTYPALAGFSYTPITVSQGYGFYASTYTYVVDPTTGQLKLTPEAVILAVQPIGGKLVVAAGVGRGEFATTIRP